MRKEILMIICLVGTMIMAGTAYANDDSFIYGIVTDGNGAAVTGADVTIVCNKDGAAETTYTTTDNTGHYGVEFKCPAGKTVTVTAHKDGIGTASSTSEIETGSKISVMDVVYEKHANVNVSIPEFPVALLPAMLTVFGVGLVRKKF